MKDPPQGDKVRERMQQLRCEIDEDVEDVSASARTMLDWKHYVKTHPWMCCIAAVALGFLIVPKRPRATPATADTAVEPTATGHVVVKSGPTITAGVIDAILAAVANIAIQRATACLGRSAGRLLGTNDQHEASHHDSKCTP
jgi:hypothetical protein